MNRLLIALTALLALASMDGAARTEDWKAGVAKRSITPRENIWMSGYGHRDRPAEGKLTDLWAKALVLEDPRGERVALVTLDLVGIDRATALAMRRTIEERHDLARARLALCTSHTHTGPVVRSNLRAMYQLSDAQWSGIEEYAERLVEETAAVVDEAFADLRVASLSWGKGTAEFAVNRRENPESDVRRLREEGKLKGPVDHDVPVLVARRGGRVEAIVAGYACHATVLGFYAWSGDYPGFAQSALEEIYPHATALFWAGCGGDQNPLPRRRVALARRYGRDLARAVEKVIGRAEAELHGTLDAVYDEIDLPFAALPTREEIETMARRGNRFEQGRARHLLEAIDRDGALAPTYPYPVQTWRLGDEVLFVILGGEVVVDYALRLKRELGERATWVAGYANDVMAYIPSRRVLAEGGYEGATSMIYYGMPSVWAPEIEELIVEQVRDQAGRLRAREKQP